MTKRHWYVASTIVATFAILAGGRYVSQTPPGEQQSQSKTAVPRSFPSGAKAGFHMPTSAEKVDMTVHLKATRGAPTSPEIIVVRLYIRKGWHVNANPASLPFLIPTVEKATVKGQPARLDITYPLGRNSNIVLQNKAIRVYDDGAILKASVPPLTFDRFRSAGSLAVAVTVQSCSNKGICLPPATLTSTLPYQS